MMEERDWSDEDANFLVSGSLFVWLLCAADRPSRFPSTTTTKPTFSQYHTYAWGSNNANPIKNSILAQVAQQDIKTAMQQKGFQKVQENQSPDLILPPAAGSANRPRRMPGVCAESAAAWAESVRSRTLKRRWS